jgi:hypothetical protein
VCASTRIGCESCLITQAELKEKLQGCFGNWLIWAEQLCNLHVLNLLFSFSFFIFSMTSFLWL